jgi:hypothetical protein
VLMRRIFRPLPRLPLRAVGPLTVSVITPVPLDPWIRAGSACQHRLLNALWPFMALYEASPRPWRQH